MTWIWFLPSICQGLLILIDEFGFHHQRGLPRWERLGHPIDTLGLLACLLWVFTQTPNESDILVYVASGVVSSLLITKDEWIHAQLSGGSEQWLHAVLFLVHPLVIVSHGALWMLFGLPLRSTEIRLVVLMECLAVGLFFVYQIAYWNFFRKSQAGGLKERSMV